LLAQASVYRKNAYGAYLQKVANRTH